MYKGKRREDPKAKGQPSKPAKRQVQSKKPQQSYDERREKDYDEDRYAAAQEDDEEEEEEEEDEREDEEQEGSDGRYSDKRSLSSEGSADEEESPDNENHEENDDYGVRKIHDYEEDEEERNEEDEQDNTQDEITRSTGNISSKTYPRSRNSKIASRASTNQNYDESRGNTQYEDDHENEADSKPGVTKVGYFIKMQTDLCRDGKTFLSMFKKVRVGSVESVDRQTKKQTYGHFIILALSLCNEINIEMISSKSIPQSTV